MGDRSIRVSLYRGGTSKGVFVRLTDLPQDARGRDEIALALMGSPDPMQLDGLGGTHSSTSKLVAIATPAEARALGHDVPADAEVAYLFAQIAIDRAVVDWRGNCGNLTAAVGAFALREGMLAAEGDVAGIRLFNLNTLVAITLRQPLLDGAPLEAGSFAMPGVPGTGARIDLVFHEPASAITGRVLPTGRALEEIPIGSLRIEATILDVTNPVVIVRAVDLGITGTESPAELNRDAGLLRRIEEVRGIAAVRCGLVADPSDAEDLTPIVPRVILVGPPSTHQLASGEVIEQEDADFVVRTSSMGVIHHAFTGTGLMAAAAAAAIPGTIFDKVGGVHAHGVRLAHPKGVVPLVAMVRPGDPEPVVDSVAVARTARLLLRGEALPRPVGTVRAATE